MLCAKEFNLFSENDKKASFWLLINVLFFFYYSYTNGYIGLCFVSNLNPRLNIELHFYNMITLSMIKKRH